MSEAPLISVIIPCHNLGRYLDEAVDSVLGQTCQDFEILIVDDGSDDEQTVRLLDGFDRPKTQVFRTRNRGLARARNFLVERARGTCLCALDADDRLHREYFAKALAVFEEDPTITFVSSWLEAFGEEQWVWRQERCDLAALLAEDTLTTAAVVRRQAVLAVGGYDEAMPAPGDEDWDLWLRLAKAGYTGKILPEVLFFYRRRSGSMSTDCVEGDTHLSLVRYLVAKHRDSYREHMRSVLLAKERAIAELLRANHLIERRIGQGLRPDVIRLRAELEKLRRRAELLRGPSTGTAGGGTVGGPRTPAAGENGSRLAALDAEYRRARQEIADLRCSLSWRLTAPLRAIYDLVLRVKR